MNSFAYQARDKEGLAINGVVEAETEVAVVENLRHLGYSVVAIHKQGLTFKRCSSPGQKISERSQTRYCFFCAAIIRSFEIRIADYVGFIEHCPADP